MTLSRDELIKESLREGRKRWMDLERELVKSGKISLATLSRGLKDLEKNGTVERIVDDSKRPAITWYTLAEFELPFKRKVKSVLEELRREYRFFKEPLVKEIAVKVGKAPEIVGPLLYELAPETGWKEQEREQAKEETEESINLAAWMRWLQKPDKSGKYSSTQIEELNRKAEEEIQQATPDVFKRAKRILENYPELLPEAKPSIRGRIMAPAGLDPWPEETEKVWRRVFQEEAPSSGRPVFGFGT